MAFYDEEIARASTPRELREAIENELATWYDTDMGGLYITSDTLGTAVSVALFIRGRHLDLDLPDVPSDIAGLLNWCINCEKIMAKAKKEAKQSVESTENMGKARDMNQSNAKDELLKEFSGIYDKILVAMNSALSEPEDKNIDQKCFDKLIPEVTGTIDRTSAIVEGVSKELQSLPLLLLLSKGQRVLMFLAALMSSANICRDRSLEESAEDIEGDTNASTYIVFGCNTVQNYLPLLEDYLQKFKGNEGDLIGVFQPNIDLIGCFDTISERIIQYKGYEGAGCDYLSLMYVFDFCYFLGEAKVALMNLEDIEVSPSLLKKIQVFMETISLYLSRFSGDFDGYIRKNKPETIIEDVGIAFKRLDERRKELEDLSNELKMIDWGKLMVDVKIDGVEIAYQASDEGEKGEDMIETVELKTVQDYIDAVSTALLGCSGNLDPEEADGSDYGGVFSLIFNALDSCEALYAASRKSEIEKRMSSTPESFSTGWTRIYADSSSYIKNSNPKPKLTFKAGNSLALHCFMLYGYAGLIEKLQVFFDSPDFAAIWPRNPDAQVFTASGQSYLEAMFDFIKENASNAAMLLNSLLDKMLEKNPKMKGKFKGLPVFDNPILKCWQDHVLKYMRHNLPVQDISNTAMRTEFNSVRAKVEHECKQFTEKRFKSVQGNDENITTKRGDVEPIYAAIVEQTTEDTASNQNLDIPLKDNEIEVLNYLNEAYPELKYQADMAGLPISENKKLPSRKTIGKIIAKLKDFDLVKAPEGKSNGIIITTKGHNYIDTHF